MRSERRAAQLWRGHLIRARGRCPSGEEGGVVEHLSIVLLLVAALCEQRGAHGVTNHCPPLVQRNAREHLLPLPPLRLSYRVAILSRLLHPSLALEPLALDVLEPLVLRDLTHLRLLRDHTVHLVHPLPLVVRRAPFTRCPAERRVGELEVVREVAISAQLA